MKNRFCVFLILILLLMAGCTKGNTVKEETFEAVGEIIKFEDNVVSLLSGDIVFEYKIGSEEIRNYFIGERVKVKKNGWKKYSLVKYDNLYDNENYTNSGEIITKIEGKVTDKNDETFLLFCDVGYIEFDIPETVEIQDDDPVIIEFIEGKEKNIILNIIDKNTEMKLFVRDIIREEDTGIMKIEAIDENDIRYDVCVIYGTMLEVNLYDIKINDNILVYPKVISDSNPPRVDARLITK